MAQKAYDSERDDYKTPPEIYQPILDFIGKKARINQNKKGRLLLP